MTAPTLPQKTSNLRCCPNLGTDLLGSSTTVAENILECGSCCYRAPSHHGAWVPVRFETWVSVVGHSSNLNVAPPCDETTSVPKPGITITITPNHR